MVFKSNGTSGLPQGCSAVQRAAVRCSVSYSVLQCAVLKLVQRVVFSKAVHVKTLLCTQIILKRDNRGGSDTSLASKVT